MKRIEIVATVLAVVAVASSTKAQGTTGADLLQQCQVVNVSKPDDVAMVQGIQCVAYLTGISHGFSLWNAFNNNRKQNNPAPACVPEKATGRELAMVVAKYINEHPAIMHEPSPAVVLAAFSDAYPCKNPPQ